MLPPFVPPYARAEGESLPLITKFVVDRVEHSFENTSRAFDGSGQSAAAVGLLPSIDEFVKGPALEEPSYDEFVQRTSRSPWGTYEAKHEVAGSGVPPQVMPASIALEPDMLLVGHHPPAGSQDAVLNEIAEPADAWAASAAAASASEGAGPTAATEPPSQADSGDSTETDKPGSVPSPNSPEGWVAEERDAFDWHSVASLAVPPAEEARAAEEWSSTEWERSSGSVQDHVSILLAQISRRVRSGELEVQGSKQMSAEAALVAALGALLAESAKKQS